MQNIQIGKVHTGFIFRQVENGYILRVNDRNVFLPFEDTDYYIDDDESINVFIFNNEQKKLQATTHIPSVQVGIYDWAKVTHVNPNIGVFVNIGIDKNILMPHEQLPSLISVWPQIGDYLYVTLNVQKDNLIALLATEEVFFNHREIATNDLFNASISGHVYNTGREGTAFFSNDQYRGFIHHTERNRELRIGELVTGRVIDVKSDGTVNVSLLPLKEDRIAQDAEAILNLLNELNGIIPFSDDSDPKDIRHTFGFSKSAFKRALGKLLKEGKVKQKNGQTYMTQKDQ